MASLLTTKFHLPPIPAGYVPRPHLLKMLDEAVSRRMTLVSASAGAGKTTLVSAWATERRQKGAALSWLSLDSADNDLGRFLEYLVACLEEWGMVTGAAKLSPRASEQIKLEPFLDELIGGLTNLKQAIVLILDDYHLIQSHPIHAAVEYLSGHAFPYLRLVLLTRSDPPLELARLRLTGQLAELRMEHLRFSAAETAEFLKKTAGLQLAEQDVAALNERTEGWAAGLQMAAISLRGREDASAFIAAFAGSHRFVFDYLFEQVLSLQPDDVREFLLNTSVLERLSAPLCDALTGAIGTSRSLLDRIERSNLFLIPLDDERGWYRYHHLFASSLQQAMEQTQPDLRRALHRRACSWHESQGLLPEALHHALAAEDMELAARLVSSNVLALVEQADLAPILLQMEGLPRQQRSALPWLGVAHAWGLAYAGQLDQAETELNIAEKQAGQLPQEERGRILGHITAVRAYRAWSFGDQSEAIAFAEHADSLLPTEETAVRALNLTTLGNALTQYSPDPRADEILDKATSFARQAGQPHVLMLASGGLAYVCFQSGQFRRALQICEDAIEAANLYQRRTGRILTAAASVYAFQSRVFWEWGEIETAIQAAQKGVALSELWGQADTIMVCLLYLAQALAYAGEWEPALQVLQRARKIARNVSPWHRANVDLVELDLWLENESQKASETYHEIMRQHEASIEQMAVTQARLLLKQNHPDKALALLKSMPPEMEQLAFFGSVRLQILLALIYFQKKEISPALAALEQALAQAEPENRLGSFVREGERMEKLLQLALAKTNHVQFVRRVLEAFQRRHKHSSEPPASLPPLIEPLSGRELEILSLLKSYLSSVEIADQLVISVNTVRTHMKSIYGKLGVHGRSEAVGKAKELGLLK